MEKTQYGICTVKDRIKFYECDYKGRPKLSSLLKIAAELAGYDYTIKGYSHEYLWAKQMVFLLSRISLKILQYPKQQQNIVSSTWECGKKGAMFMRGTDIEDTNGNVMVSVSSGWVLVNPVTRHIYKPSAFEAEMPQLMDRAIYANSIGKIRYSELTSIGSRAVRISDLDANGHVYNATYSDIACDFLDKETYEKDIDNFRINFVSEATLGDTIEVFKDETSEKSIIIGKVNDKVCFETEFTWK